jgi:hypothetical protein
LFTDANLASLTICGAVSISLERGNCDASCFAYVMLQCRVAGRHFGNYKAGFRFGQVGYELVERRGLRRFEASTYLVFVIVVARWMKHVRASRDVLRRAFEAAKRIGDLTNGAHVCNNLNSDLLFAGDPLPDAECEAEHGMPAGPRTGTSTCTTSSTTSGARSTRWGDPSRPVHPAREAPAIAASAAVARVAAVAAVAAAGAGSARGT